MTKNKIIAGVVALSVGLASITTIALANDNNKNKDIHGTVKSALVTAPIGSSPEVSITAKGKVSLSGAKVTAVSGSGVSVTVAPVGISLNFTLNTSPTTTLMKRSGGKATLAEIKVGDYLAVRGTLVAGSASPVINVTSIRDYTIENDPFLHKVIFDGKLVSLPAGSVPTTFVATFNGKNYTVNVPAGISIVNKDYQTTSIGNFKVGDNIRVYGAVRVADTTIIDASIVRDVTLK